MDTSVEVMMALLTLTGPRHMPLMQLNPFAGTEKSKKFACWGAERCGLHFWLDGRLLSCLGAAQVLDNCSLLSICTSFASCSSGCNIVYGVMAVLSWKVLPSTNTGSSHSSSSRLVHEPKAFAGFLQVKEFGCKSLFVDAQSGTASVQKREKGKKEEPNVA